jgi:hypothetical protein
LVDGSTDAFIAEEDITLPAPDVDLRCIPSPGTESIQLTCKILENFEVSIASDGDVTFSIPLLEIETDLIALVKSGEVRKDACICDVLVPDPPFPAMRDNIL